MYCLDTEQDKGSICTGIGAEREQCECSLLFFLFSSFYCENKVCIRMEGLKVYDRIGRMLPYWELSLKTYSTIMV